jgi:hypothetical protein
MFEPSKSGIESMLRLKLEKELAAEGVTRSMAKIQDAGDATSACCSFEPLTIQLRLRPLNNMCTKG